MQPQPETSNTDPNTADKSSPNIAVPNGLINPATLEPGNQPEANHASSTDDSPTSYDPTDGSGGTNDSGFPNSLPEYDPAAIPALPYIAGSRVQLGTDGGLVVGSATIPNGQSTSIGTKQVYVGPEGVVIGGSSTYPYAVPAPVLASPTPAIPIQVGDQEIQRASNGQGVVFGSSTVRIGSQATISGHEILAGSSYITVDHTSYALPALPAPSPVVIDGHTAQKASAGGVIFDGVTVLPSQTTTVASHTVYAAGPSNIVIDKSSYALPAAASSEITVGGQTLYRAPNSGVIFDSKIVQQGSKTSIGGHLISAGLNSIILDQSTIALAPASPSNSAQTIPAVIISGQSVQRGANGVVTFGSTLITPGAQPEVIEGHTIYAGLNNVNVDGHTFALPMLRPTGSKPLLVDLPTSDQDLLQGSKTSQIPSEIRIAHVLSTAGVAFTEVNGQIEVEGSTLQNGMITTIHGTRVSAGRDNLVIGSTTIPIPTSGPSSTFPTEASALTTLGHTFIPIGSDEVDIDGTTFSSGGEGTTIDGSQISVGSSGLIIGSSTIPISVPSTASNFGAMTTDDYTLSRLDASRVVVDGQTLTQGRAAETVDGLLVSIGASKVDIGTRRISFPTESITSKGYGDFIIGGLQGSQPVATQSPLSSPIEARPSSSGARGNSNLWTVGLALGFGFWKTILTTII